jgi:apolipoprotein N-acyltransferase
MRILSLLLLLFVTGCSTLQPAPLVTPEPVIKTVTEFKTLEIYQPPLPEAINLEDVQFFVITTKNLEEQIAKLEQMQSGDFVLFGLTPQDYENMAYNLQELRRYVRQQKEIILYYRQATQGEENTDSEDWLDRNEEVVSGQLTNP